MQRKKYCNKNMNNSKFIGCITINIIKYYNLLINVLYFVKIKLEFRISCKMTHGTCVKYLKTLNKLLWQSFLIFTNTIQNTVSSNLRS